MSFNFINATIYAILTGISILCNISVFMMYLCNFGRSIRNKSIQLIIHLLFTNVLMLISKGIPKTIAAFGMRNFLDDTGCKIICYLERVERSLSICNSGLLMVVQAVTISPRHSGWKKLMPRSPCYILLLLLIFWVLNSFIAMNLLHSITSINMNLSQVSSRDSYCFFLPESKKVKGIVLTFMVLRDMGCQGIMCGARGYMVSVLHKHHQQVFHLQNSKFLYRTPPKIKADHNVLFLMLCFLLFYWTDCVLSLFISSSLTTEFTVISAQEFLTLSYAVLSPFVLIHREGHLGHCRSSGWTETLRLHY